MIGILFVKWMASKAMRFLRIFCRQCIPTERIDFLCHDVHMVRIHTSSIAAEMIDLDVRRNWPN